MFSPKRNTRRSTRSGPVLVVMRPTTDGSDRGVPTWRGMGALPGGGELARATPIPRASSPQRTARDLASRVSSVRFADQSLPGTSLSRARSPGSSSVMTSSTVAARKAARAAAEALSKANADEINHRAFGRLLLERSETTFAVQQAMQ
jgi:hypothetical protein